MHGLFMGSKADCDKLLESSGILGVPGITYKYYSESDFLTAAIKIAGMTEGESLVCTPFSSPAVMSSRAGLHTCTRALGLQAPDTGVERFLG